MQLFHPLPALLPFGCTPIDCEEPQPRILHCAETIAGGIASYLRELLPLQLAAYGPGNVMVIVPASQASELPLPSGVLRHLYADSSKRALRAFRLALDVVHLVRVARPSIVHVHSTFAGATVRPMLMLAGQKVPVVYCAHGWAWDRMTSWLAKATAKNLERALANITSRVVCISAFEYRAAIDAGLPEHRLCVVKNAIGARPPAAVGEPPEWPTGKRRILFVGRIDRQKGLDVLLDALAILGDSAHAVVAGASVLGDSEVTTSQPNVTRLGWQSPGQLATLFASADVLVVPSRWEGFGLVAAEAMRAGLPVIATRVGGLPEVVEDGVTGLVIEPDSARAICDAIQRLDAKTLARMGEAGRDRVRDHFTMDRLHRELSLVYDAVQGR